MHIRLISLILLRYSVDNLVTNIIHPIKVRKSEFWTTYVTCLGMHW